MICSASTSTKQKMFLCDSPDWDNIEAGDIIRISYLYEIIAVVLEVYKLPPADGVGSIECQIMLDERGYTYHMPILLTYTMVGKVEIL